MTVLLETAVQDVWRGFERKVEYLVLLDDAGQWYVRCCSGLWGGGRLVGKHVIMSDREGGGQATHWWSSGCVLKPFVTFIVRFAPKVDDVRLFPICTVHLLELGCGGGGSGGGRCI